MMSPLGNPLLLLPTNPMLPALPQIGPPRHRPSLRIMEGGGVRLMDGCVMGSCFHNLRVFMSFFGNSVAAPPQNNRMSSFEYDSQGSGREGFRDDPGMVAHEMNLKTIIDHSPLDILGPTPCILFQLLPTESGQLHPEIS